MMQEIGKKRKSNGPEKSENACHPPNSKNFVFDDLPPLKWILTMRRGRKCDFFVRLLELFLTASVEYSNKHVRDYHAISAPENQTMAKKTYSSPRRTASST
jgi:hypothetical protein